MTNQNASINKSSYCNRCCIDQISHADKRQTGNKVNVTVIHFILSMANINLDNSLLMPSNLLPQATLASCGMRLSDDMTTGDSSRFEFWQMMPASDFKWRLSLNECDADIDMADCRSDKCPFTFV